MSIITYNHLLTPVTLLNVQKNNNRIMSLLVQIQVYMEIKLYIQKNLHAWCLFLDFLVEEGLVNRSRSSFFWKRNPVEVYCLGMKNDEDLGFIKIDSIIESVLKDRFIAVESSYLATRMLDSKITHLYRKPTSPKKIVLMNSSP